MNVQPISVMVITNIPTPYRIPLFNQLSQEPEIDLKVLFLGEHEAERGWDVSSRDFDFDYKFMNGWHTFLARWEIPIHLNWGVWLALMNDKPEIVITSGYDNPAYWQAALYARLFHKKFILWNGTTCLSSRQLSGPIAWFKRNVIRSADACVTYGTKAADYLKFFGVEEERIVVGVNAVDMDRFKHMTEACRRRPSFVASRSEYPSFLILYVGRLVQFKGVRFLLEALGKINDPDFGLIIVGSGPQEAELRRFCSDEGLNNVFIEGSKTSDELPIYYALADLVVLPTLWEVWGLVVNEALASGNYVLCSDRAGAGHDLITDEWNGALFDPTNMDMFVKLLLASKLKSVDIRSRRGDISSQACREYSIRKSTDAFIKAVRMVASN